MTLRRILLALVLLVTLCGVTLIFLAGRPPRTFAASWTAPGTLAGDAGSVNFGAVPEPVGRWDLLWVDQHNRVLFLPGTGASARPITVDHGDVDQATLVRVGHELFGAWIHNYNGGTRLEGMEVAVGQTAPRVFTLVRGSAPIEHPYAFAGPLGRPSLVFSWEKYGNFDAFLLSLPPTGTHPVVERRLTVAQSYSFNPQAVTDSRGHVDVLHYESCCAQQNFKIEWNRFDASGRSIAPTKVLGVVQERGVNTLQWGEALGRDGAGDIWGAFTLDSGVGLLHARPDGTLVGPAESLDPVPEQPQSVALALGPSGGYGFWEENNGIGTNLESRHFDATSAGDIERIEYISGQQHNVHAAFFGSQYRVLWQTITPSGAYVFQTNEHRKAAGPDLAERLGLGLGNPWEAAALLFGGALGLGILAAVINVVDAIVLTLLGMLLLRVLRSVAGRWVIVTLLLTGIFFAMFVSPGLPVIFLTTLPGLGFDGAQFVVPAIAGALLFVGLLSQTGLRRIDDIYRLGAMAFVGIFFFGFIEAALFVQQELGYI